MTKAELSSHVAVLGASPKEDRYSFRAVHLLKEDGFQPIPVHPAGHIVDGIKAVKTLDDITVPIDTLTIYVGQDISNDEQERIFRLNPRRVIFNPGAENESLAEKLEKAGIEVVRGCTLVMLKTNLF